MYILVVIKLFSSWLTSIEYMTRMIGSVLCNVQLNKKYEQIADIQCTLAIVYIYAVMM